MAVELNNFDEVERGFEHAVEVFAPLAVRAMAVSLQAVQAAISPYPQQPDRDRAETFNTYVRGRGNYPKRAFKQDSNQPGGYRIRRLVTAKQVAEARLRELKAIQTKAGVVRLTSEQMDKRYHTKVSASGGYLVGELRNTASYSGWVVGPKDAGADPHQVPWHTATGWPNADDALEQAMPEINAALDRAVVEFMQRVIGR